MKLLQKIRQYLCRHVLVSKILNDRNQGFVHVTYCIKCNKIINVKQVFTKFKNKK